MTESASCNEFQLIRRINELKQNFSCTKHKSSSDAEMLMADLAWQLWQQTLHANHLNLAVQLIESALKIEDNKESPVLWFRLARLHTASCKYIDAINVYTAICMDYHTYEYVAVAQFTLGAAARRIALFSAALKYFEELALLDECAPFNRVDALIQLAWTHEIVHQMSEDLQSSDTAIQMWELAYALHLESEAENMCSPVDPMMQTESPDANRLKALYGRSQAVPQQSLTMSSWKRWRQDMFTWLKLGDRFYKFECYLVAVT